MKIEQVIDSIVAREGGYVDHPHDRGGATCWGITERVALAAGYAGPMQALPQATARKIYLQRYWLGPGYDRVGKVSGAIAEELADTGVNMGPATAGKFLQRGLNVLNQEARLFADLRVDGAIGPTSRAALAAYLDHRGPLGERVLLTALNCLQGAHYIEIAEGRPSQEDFVYGWLRERVTVSG